MSDFKEIKINVKGQGDHMNIILKVSLQITYWPNFTSQLYIVSEIFNVIIWRKKSTFEDNHVTLTFSQGHHMSYTFEGLFIGYHLTKFQISILNNVKGIQKQAKNAFSTLWVNTVTLTFGQGHHIMKSMFKMTWHEWIHCSISVNGVISTASFFLH